MILNKENKHESESIFGREFFHSFESFRMIFKKKRKRREQPSLKQIDLKHTDAPSFLKYILTICYCRTKSNKILVYDLK